MGSTEFIEWISIAEDEIRLVSDLLKEKIRCQKVSVLSKRKVDANGKCEELVKGLACVLEGSYLMIFRITNFVEENRI